MVGVETVLGEPVAVSRFAEHVFGVCLVNDWSARDIQAFESVPLGPFTGKSFGTTVSPRGSLPLAALEHARVRPPSRGTAVADYLTETADWGLDIAVEVRINSHLVSRPPYAPMHWSPAQMLAHLTVNGAALRTGDLYASARSAARPATSAAACWSWPGTAPTRCGCRTAPSGPGWPTATRSASPPPRPARTGPGSAWARPAARSCPPSARRWR